MKTQEMQELSQGLSEMSGRLADATYRLDAHILSNTVLAERVLDFERGVVTLPELVRDARATLEVVT